MVSNSCVLWQDGYCGNIANKGMGDGESMWKQNKLGCYREGCYPKSDAVGGGNGGVQYS